ncbi:MAG: hypothetical protein EZS28_043508 [Streblomastix strix]|uniref:Uncharacterized protein n=1 Tax=Streblomastix strix TaxID=222440 RepID=A0A5J4TU95_9EUKA|nr:MAG: hypothetical protein EZS28_043508 [Streblomastix strix]
MSSVTDSSFIKFGADDTVVLLGADGTKTISEFVSAPTDLSNYYTKTQTYSRTETDQKYVILEVFKADTALLDDYVTTNTTQYIGGEKTFNANINATGFIKTNKDDTSVLLAGRGDALVSSLGGVQVEDLTNLIVTTLISNIESISSTITPSAPPSTIYPITLATKRKTLTGVLSFRNIRVSTDSTEAWGTNDEIGPQFS